MLPPSEGGKAIRSLEEKIIKSKLDKVYFRPTPWIHRPLRARCSVQPCAPVPHKKLQARSGSRLNSRREIRTLAELGHVSRSRAR